MQKPKYTFKIGILLFIFITFLTSMIILFKTFNLKALSAMKSIKLIHIIVISLLIILNWLMETFKLQVLTAIANAKIKFKPALYAVLGNIFLSAITPFQSGGGAIQIYIMYQYGIGAGKGTAISFLKFSLTLFALALSTPIILIFNPELLKVQFLRSFFVISLFISLLIMLACFYLLIKPKFLKNLSVVILNFLNRIKLLSRNKLRHWIRLIIKEIDIFNEINISCWKYHKLKLFYGLILSILVLVTQFLIAPVILLFLYPQIKMNFFNLIYFTIIVQLVITFIMYFIPTPGGSGAVEIGFMAFFQDLMPVSILGIYTILWRFISQIFSVIIGGIITFKVVGVKELRMLSQKKEVLEEGESHPHID